MMFLGIDPGFATTGFAVIEVDGEKLSRFTSTANEIRLQVCGTIKTLPAVPFPDRLLEIEKNLEEILASYDIEQAAVEKIYFAKNKKTAMDVAHARGVMLSVLARKKIVVLEYTPIQIKKAITGRGSVDKKIVGSMLKSLLNLDEDKWRRRFQDDASDAIAVAVCSYYAQRSLRDRQVV